MRAATLVLTVLFITNVVLGQTTPKAIAMEEEAFTTYFSKRTVPTVKGRIKNLSNEEIKKIVIEYSLVTPFEKLQKTKSCTLAADGTFEFKLDYPFPYQQIWIEVDSLFYTGVYANSDLFIELDAALLKKQKDPSFYAPGVSYLGGDGALNTYINNRRLFQGQRHDELQTQVQNCLWSDLEDQSFLQRYDSLFALLNRIDDAYIEQHPSPYSWIVKNERQSDYLGYLCFRIWEEPQMPQVVYQKVKAHKAYLTSNEGMLFYKYITNYVRRIALKQTNEAPGPHDLPAINRRTIFLLDSLFSPAKADFLKLKIPSADPGEQKQNLETILPTVKTVWCKNVLRAEYKKTLQKVASINRLLKQTKLITSPGLLGRPIGELSFGAKLYEVKGVKAHQLLPLLQASFKDKALYIDFWATWCGPCIAEFPHSRKLSEESKELPVEFIYLCTSESSDMEKWKSKIVEYKLSGHHFFVEKSVASALMELLSLSGYPSYLFIGTKGERRAAIPPRPSSLNREKLITLMEQ